MPPYPKAPKPKVRPKYREYTKKKPCAICGNPNNIHFSHQRLLGGGISSLPDDKYGLPACNTCHILTEHQKGILTLWNTRSGLYFDNKHDLRDYLRVVCYFTYNRYLLERRSHEHKNRKIRFKD